MFRSRLFVGVCPSLFPCPLLSDSYRWDDEDPNVGHLCSDIKPKFMEEVGKGWPWFVCKGPRLLQLPCHELGHHTNLLIFAHVCLKDSDP